MVVLLAKDSVFSYPAISECPETQNKSICIALTVDCYLINCISATILELQAFDLRACNALLGKLEKMVEFSGYFQWVLRLHFWLHTPQQCVSVQTSRQCLESKDRCIAHSVFHLWTIFINVEAIVCLLTFYIGRTYFLQCSGSAGEHRCVAENKRNE